MNQSRIRILFMAVMTCAVAAAFAIGASAALAADSSGSKVAVTTIQTDDASTQPKVLDPSVPSGTITLQGRAELLQEGAFPGPEKLKLGAQATSLSKQRRLEMAREQIRVAFCKMWTSPVDLSAYRIDGTDLSNAVSSVINNDPDLWYVAGGYSWSTDYYTGYVESFTPRYIADKTTIGRMKANLDSAVDQALSWIPNDASDAYRAKAAHDWLVLNCAYYVDIDNVDYYTVPPERNPWSAYGALVYRQPVCQGYALAYQLLLSRMGIPANTATSSDHAWNRVQIDGTWYHVDTTWDDPIPDSPGVTRATWFLRSEYWVRARGGSSHSWWRPAEPYATDTRYDGDPWWPSYYGPAYRGSLYGFDLNSSTIVMDTYKKKWLYIKDKWPSGFDTSQVKWSSSNPSVARVNSMGAVTSASQPGIAKITCTVGGISRECIVKVQVNLAETASLKLSKSSVPYYWGKPRYVTPTVKIGTRTLRKGVDYTVKHTNNGNVGTATVTITGKGNYSGKLTRTFKITKGYNPITGKNAVTTAAKTVSLAKVKAAQQAVKPITVKSSRGKISYEKLSGSWRLIVGKQTGKVTVRKGTPAGTYTAMVRVSASGNANVKAGSHTVKVTVHVTGGSAPAPSKPPIRESESNDTYSAADPVKVGQTISGKTSYDDDDFFSVYVGAPGTYTVHLANDTVRTNGINLHAWLYDSSYDSYSQEIQMPVNKKATSTVKVSLKKGRNYIWIWGGVESGQHAYRLWVTRG